MVPSAAPGAQTPTGLPVSGPSCQRLFCGEAGGPPAVTTAGKWVWEAESPRTELTLLTLPHRGRSPHRETQHGNGLHLLTMNGF